MKTLVAIIALTLAGCVTQFRGPVGNVTITPSTSLRVQGLPLSMP